MPRPHLRNLVLLAAALTAPTLAQAAGQTTAYVDKVSFAKSLPSVVFKIGNVSPQTTSEARDIRVIGPPQDLSVSGTVKCQPGARAAQADFYQANAYINAAGSPHYQLIVLGQAQASEEIGQDQVTEAVHMSVPVD